MQVGYKNCLHIFHFNGTLMVTGDFVYFKLDAYQFKNMVGSSFVDQIFLGVIILWHPKYSQALKCLYHSVPSEHHSYQPTVYIMFYFI